MIAKCLGILNIVVNYNQTVPFQTALPIAKNKKRLYPDYYQSFPLSINIFIGSFPIKFAQGFCTFTLIKLIKKDKKVKKSYSLDLTKRKR
jgi:hypothetical protein